MTSTVAEQGEPCSNYKANAVEGRRNEERLRKLLTSELNAVCADCRVQIEHRTAWASINLGVYLCIQWVAGDRNTCWP